MRPISVTEKLADSHLPGLIVSDAHTQLGSLEAKVVTDSGITEARYERKQSGCNYCTGPQG